MKDTLRLLLYLDCNLNCPYCCNKLSQYNNQFEYKTLEEINFDKYENVCLTGGEPFLYKKYLFDMLEQIPGDKNIYIYTNGLLITRKEMDVILRYKNIKCINIGVHSLDNLDKIYPVENFINTRFMIQDIYKEEAFSKYPRLTINNTKFWKLNNCQMNNEDWIILKS